jgi:hypothetical protein
MLISPSKSRDLADENKKKLTQWKWFETTVLDYDIEIRILNIDKKKTTNRTYWNFF